jgi:hypothetical protein
MLFLVKKILWRERKIETLRCRDATAGSLTVKVLGEVFAHFHAVAVKVNSSIPD